VASERPKTTKRTDGVGRDRTDPRRVIEQVRQWRDELINLARGNRLLYFRHTKSSTLEITVEPDEAAAVVRELLEGGSWRFFIPPDPDPEEEDSEDVSPPPVPAFDELLTQKPDGRSVMTALRALDRRATQEFMDKGLWVLYLAAGMLKWRDPETKETAESPILLIPVELRRESVREPYRLVRADEDLVINPALAVKMEEYSVTLPGVDDDAGDVDLDVLLERADRAVRNRDGWEVERRLVLSYFSFYKEVMYRDLLDNEEEVAAHELVEALVLGASEESSIDFEPIPEERLDDEAPAEETAMIRDADASQRQCIAAAEAGASFVLDGPPGTGKSQTIANIIAQLLLVGRTVLFVSEKAAALEVVQKRLQEAGLDDYVLEVHSHKARRKEVAQQLGRSLEAHPRARSKTSSDELHRLKERRKELNARAQALNEIREPLGWSLHWAIGRVSALQSCPQAPLPEAIDGALSDEKFTKILSVARELSRAWGPVSRASDFHWHGMKERAFDSQTTSRLREQVETARVSLHDVIDVSEACADDLLLITPTSVEECEELLKVLKCVAERRAVPEWWLTMRGLDSLTDRIEELSRLHGELREVQARLRDEAGPDWLKIDVAWHEPIERSLVEVEDVGAGWLLPASATASDCSSVAGTLEEAKDILERILADATYVAERFALPTDGLSVSRAKELGKLAASTTLKTSRMPIGSPLGAPTRCGERSTSSDVAWRRHGPPARRCSRSSPRTLSSSTCRRSAHGSPLSTKVFESWGEPTETTRPPWRRARGQAGWTRRSSNSFPLRWNGRVPRRTCRRPSDPSLRCWVTSTTDWTQTSMLRSERWKVRDDRSLSLGPTPTRKRWQNSSHGMVRQIRGFTS